jgi:signal transduction histidine kinase/CheY-like chemotaxis protein
VCEDAPGTVSAHGRARELFGRTSFATLGAALSHVLGPEWQRAEVEQAIARARSGTPTELIAPSGLQVRVASDGAGGAEVALLPAPRTAEPEVAARVSHELANALGAIAGWARLAKQGQRVAEALSLIEMSADSAWSAARRLLQGARTQPSSGDGIDLSAFVEEAAKLLGPKALAKGVRVLPVIEPGLRVHGDRGSAWSIVWNLGANAIEALGQGGCVELRVSAVGEDVRLEVVDDGPGMSEEQERRAFEPYFTTKPSGTGLGLAVVKQAVVELGGRIKLESRAGRGTRFTVDLPRNVAGSRLPAGKRSSGVFYAEPLHERVLVVDDDLGLREMIATALGMRGADVVAVSDASSALAQRGPFGVVLADLHLADVRGDVLLSALRSSGAARVGLLMSGGELPEPCAAGGEPDAVLRKPFELEELFEALARVLDGRDGGRRNGGRSSATG